MAVAFLVGTFLDTDPEANRRILEWKKAGDYPFPTWLLLIVPRLGVWPLAVEIYYEIAQMVIWGINGIGIKLYFNDSDMAMRWLWLPIVVHIISWDPIQMFLGWLAFRVMAQRAPSRA